MDMDEAITIRAKGNGKYQALCIPPTYCHRPALPTDYWL